MKPFQRILSLSNRQCELLTRQLDTKATELGIPISRKHDRFAYRIADIPIHIEHPEGGASSFLAFGRNLSTGGISVLHGGFLHVGSRCTVILITHAGKMFSIAGVVQHCRHLQGMSHEVGIQFDAEIRIDLFIAENASKTKVA